MAKHVPKPKISQVRKKATKLSKKCNADTYQRVTTYTTNSKRKVQEKGKGKEKEVYLNINDSGISVPLSVNTSQNDRETTPDRKTEIIEWDTPWIPRLGDNREIRSLYAKRIRTAIMKHIKNEVWHDSVEYFFEHVLPPIRPEFNIDKIMERCIKEKTLIYDKDSMKYCWEGFSSSSMRGRTLETEVYNKPLKDVFDAITNAASKVAKIPKKTCYLHTDGNHATWSLNGSDIKPDGHIFLNPTGDTYPEVLEGRHWYNVAFTFQFKKSATSNNDTHHNIEQMIGSLYHCMAIDLCRRFTLGATIHGTRVMLWFYSRSTIICSEEFDFCSEPKTMIRLVLSLLYASKDELGWDPTITAKYEDENSISRKKTQDEERDVGQRIIEFKISRTKFRASSLDVLSETKASGIYTSGTRVYKSFCNKNKEPVIIKDYWPREEYDTEDMIRQRILNEINSESDKYMFHKFTLTPIASGRVRIGRKEDHTRAVILRGKDPSGTYEITLPDKEIGIKSKSTMTGFAGYTKHMDKQRLRTLLKQNVNQCKQKANREKPVGHRWHYRIAFKECAVPYYELCNLDDILLVLECAMRALMAMHTAGWVHRDLSPNNLYMYTDSATGEKRGLVGDLEFAKKGRTRSRSDVRTGTLDFMAVEIVWGYLSDLSSQSGSKSEGTLTGAGNPAVPSNMPTYTQDGTFISSGRRVWYSYLHDLESLWWIMVWTYFHLQGGLDDTENDMVKTTGGDIRELLFPGDEKHGNRAKFLHDNAFFDENFQKSSDHLKALKGLIVLVRVILVNCYGKRVNEGAETVLPADLESVYTPILDLFKSSAHRGMEGGTLQEMLRDENVEAQVKRNKHSTRDGYQQPAKRRKCSKESDNKVLI